MPDVNLLGQQLNDNGSAALLIIWMGISKYFHSQVSYIPTLREIRTEILRFFKMLKQDPAEPSLSLLEVMGLFPPSMIQLKPPQLL
jgi:hypothetical protein